MTTYAGLPGPEICDFWTREDSAGNYAPGESFQIGRIAMVANTGTYVDVPFHRYADGEDLADFAAQRLADLPGIVVRCPFAAGIAIGPAAIDGVEVAGKAILFDTGWDCHWRTAAYCAGHPFLTEDLAVLLVEKGAALAGIDSYNIDDTRARARPVHSRLLKAGIPICEHMTGLGGLPDSGFRFTAAPPKIVAMGSFPVRALAVLD